ncbi:helix-turn-helix domain-containing protein [Peptostreptococcus sp.]
MLKIAENIYQRRKNITQEELADFMMVTKASVSKWESGQS